eukprot:Plantae.Rhodophyta-Hildenbrandia_rubra.ctg13891.p1 GENE.Plantae.Rhodophyta-Hildenbrandia_rubra.ctg13891~~Plantae.Rhodophyta-Hildenbrandia_rubra.ctg13891.p1  ORF type:complete len:601 (+),score=95.03 Plantae.Rhodophyta-Hildenbrandia_rubra.ctg13891:210-2012(+)
MADAAFVPSACASPFHKRHSRQGHQKSAFLGASHGVWQRHRWKLPDKRYPRIALLVKAKLDNSNEPDGKSDRKGESDRPGRRISQPVVGRENGTLDGNGDGRLFEVDDEVDRKKAGDAVLNLTSFQNGVTQNAEHAKEDEADGKSDAFRLSMVIAASGIFVGLLQHKWVEEHRDLTMWGIFVLGYMGIILEELLDFSKTSVALVMGVGIWLTIMISSNGAVGDVNLELSHKLGEISEILFFLVGAMTIVEIVDSHSGFKIVTDAIKTNSRRVLLWTIGFITFFMSSILDNLTSTIVMVSLLRKLVSDPKERWLYGSIVVIAANAGGAWTPIGDVTTTMLWIHGNLSSTRTITDLFFPSLVSMVTTLSIFTPMLKGEFQRPTGSLSHLAPRGRLVFFAGLAALLSVPVFKAVTGLPPYLGMLSGLGVLWLGCDIIHAGENREELRGEAALKRIDTSGILFFLGVLLTVGGLESAGLLRDLARLLDNVVPTKELIAAAIGVISAIVDNVPLVAATMGMYDIATIPQDAPLWQLIAFCAGTGGSMLIIGSAAGVALMSIEKVPFGWFAKKMTLPTAAGFVAGILTYMTMSHIHLPQVASLAGL